MTEPTQPPQIISTWMSRLPPLTYPTNPTNPPAWSLVRPTSYHPKSSKGVFNCSNYSTLPTRTRPKRMDPPVLAPVSKSTPARRGRPAAHTPMKPKEKPNLGKKRGRPSKVKQEEPVTPVKNTPKRGRPIQNVCSQPQSRRRFASRDQNPEGTSTSKPAVLRPQRLARSGLSQPSYSQSSVQKLQVQKPAAKRGRPRKATQVEKPAVKRGRPRGVVQ